MTQSPYSRVLHESRRIMDNQNVFPNTSLTSSSPSLSDHLVGIFTGESAMERVTKQKFLSFKKFIQDEIKVAELAVKHHNLHRKTLILEFDDQAHQLQRWGLTHLLSFFRMQAWLRISRSKLLEKLSSLIHSILLERVDIISEAMDLSSISGILDKHAFLTSRLEEYCVSPEVFISDAVAVQIMNNRLIKMDKLCQLTLRRFKIMLPELEPKSISERKEILNRILTRYKSLVESIYPDNVDTISWDEFCVWYQQRHRDLMDLERGFGNFVEDDREKEGRLFRRWCSLANTIDDTHTHTHTQDEAEAAISIDIDIDESKSIASNLRSPDKYDSKVETDFLNVPQDRNNKSVPKSPASLQNSPSRDNLNQPMKTKSHRVKLELTPRTIMAFTKYFAKQILANKYKCSADLINTLLLITESLIFRKIHLVTLRYPGKFLQTKDINFRLKCIQCRAVDPVKFGVLPRYLGREKMQTVNNSIDPSINKNLENLDLTNNSNSSNNSNNSNIECSNNIDSQIPPKSEQISSSKPKAKCSGCVACCNLSLNYRLNRPPCHVKKETTTNTCIKPLDGGYTQKVWSKSPEALHGTAYYRSSKLISMMASSLCPKDIISNLLLGIKWLLRDAIDQSGKNEFIGADLMFPILVLVLIHANVPTMHLILHFLQSFSAVDNYGEAAYYVTCLEAAVQFIDRMESPVLKNEQTIDDKNDPFAHLVEENNIYKMKGHHPHSDGKFSDNYISSTLGSSEEGEEYEEFNRRLEAMDNFKDDSQGEFDNDLCQSQTQTQTQTPKDEEKAIKKLGEWIRDQQTMEETITILQQQGWMV